jgi:hypothetical protein
MAALILYSERGREYVVIDTADLSDDEFEKEYGAQPVARCPIDDEEFLTPFPTDRGLEAT